MRAVIRELLAPRSTFGAVRRALADVAAGRPVVVTDDAEREDEGDLIFAADRATPELMAFMVRHSSGFVCVALPGDECDRLGLRPMARGAGDAFGTAYQVTVDAAAGVGTGISARDRAHTARRLADLASRPDSFTCPGHIVPLRAREHGVLERGGHTEAAVDLCRLAGRRPVGVLCEIVGVGGGMARGSELAGFAARHGLTTVSIAELAAYRRRYDAPVDRVVSTVLPTRHGTFTAVGFRVGADEHLALVAGPVDLLQGASDVLVRAQPECLLGEALGSVRCSCAELLDASLAAVAAEGCGVVLYLGAGSDLLRHLPGGSLGRRTTGGLTSAERGAAVGMLADLGVVSVRPLLGSADGPPFAGEAVRVSGHVPVVGGDAGLRSIS